MKVYYTILATLPFILCGSDDEGIQKKNRWFRPKNDRPNVPVEAYHPDIPDQVEVRKELVSNKSQYLPKSVYDPDMNPVPHLDQLQQKGTKSRTSVPIPFTLPHRVQEISQQTTDPKFIKKKQVAVGRNERQDFEWKYTSLLIDQLFDHLMMREHDEHTCALIIQEKNCLLRLVSYKG